MRTSRIAPVVAIAIISLAVAGQAVAKPAHRSAPATHSAARPHTLPAVAAGRPAPATSPAASAVLPPATAGMIVGIDPETGALGPATAEQRLQLLGEEANMLSRSTVGLVERPLADGGVLLDLDGRFQEFAFVRVGPDGRWMFGCADDPPSLRRALAGTRKPAPVLEDR